MQMLVLALMTVGLLWLAIRLGFRLSDQALIVMVRGLRGWTDPWPRGVQEEDRDRPWGGSRSRPVDPPAKPASTAGPRPPLTRVRPVVRVG